MKLRYVLASIIFIAFLSACSEKNIKGSDDVLTISKDMPAFTGIVTKGNINVFVTPAANHEVRIVTDDNIAPYIETKVKNGVLTIDMDMKDNTYIRDYNRMDVYVSAPEINSFIHHGSGNLRTTAPFRSSSLYLGLNGSGDMFIQDSCGTATIDIRGSGTLELVGSATNLMVDSRGSGKTQASSFVTEHTTAHVSGSGMVNVHASKSLNAHVNGSGAIFYYGHPLQVDKDMNGSSGTIMER